MGIFAKTIRSIASQPAVEAPAATAVASTDTARLGIDIGPMAHRSMGGAMAIPAPSVRPTAVATISVESVPAGVPVSAAALTVVAEPAATITPAAAAAVAVTALAATAAVGPSLVASTASVVSPTLDLVHTDFLKANGLDWDVRKVALRTTGEHRPDTRHDPILPNYEQVDLRKHVAIMREDNKAILGVVGDNFTPCQNRFMHEAMIAAGFPERCSVRWAGPLFNGATVLLQMDVKGVDHEVGGRRVRMALDVANGHTGDKNFEAAPRLILPNGGSVAMFGGNGTLARAWRVSHRSGVRKAVTDLSKVWGGTIDLMSSSLPTIGRMITTEVDADVMRGLLVATMQRTVASTADPTTATKYAEKLMEQAAITNHASGTKSNLFDLLDRVATWVDSERRVRSGASDDRSVRRRESATEGQGARVKHALLKQILEFVADAH